MDLANLNAFIAIAETGSFSGAAERLFLTQPAISKRIALLEAQGIADIACHRHVRPHGVVLEDHADRALLRGGMDACRRVGDDP